MNEDSVRQLLAQERATTEQRLGEQTQQMQQQFHQQIEVERQKIALAEREAQTLRDALHVSMSRPAAPPNGTEAKRELRSVIDIKMLEKLEVFNGEEARWEVWLTGFESLTGLVGLEDVMATAIQPGVQMQDCLLGQLGGDDVKRKAKALWYLLSMQRESSE